MLLGLVLAMAISSYFGAPLLPVFAVGALLQSVAAFVLTRNPTPLRLAIAAAFSVAAYWTAVALLAGPGGSMLLPAFWLERTALLACALSLIASTIVGVLGQGRAPGAALVALRRTRRASSQAKAIEPDYRAIGNAMLEQMDATVAEKRAARS